MTNPDLPTEGQPLPGAPRYVLTKLLGRGGFGDAYLADDQELTRQVVIKLLMNLGDPSIRDRFKREARISANIRHPAVVQVFDIGSLPDGRPYFIMEWIDGTSLTDFIKERGATFSLSRSLALIAEAAEGLTAAHKIGVIHRDIKPDNILVTRDGHAKLIDFGIAKKAVEEADQAFKQTSMGTVLGTPRYISPEQATAKVLAAASDLYSLGCVLYTLLTGHSPFEGSAQELMMHHVYTPAPTLAASAPGRAFPPAVEGIVARLLAKDPLRRYQTGEELAKALRQAAEQARLVEESDATSAMPVVTERLEVTDGQTVSNAHSAPQLAPQFARGGDPSASHSLSASFGRPSSAGFGASEGAATAAFDNVAHASPPRKDESLSSRMPVTVMEQDLTGRTVSSHSRAPTILFAVATIILLALAGVGLKLFLSSGSHGGAAAASSETTTEAAAHESAPVSATHETTATAKPTAAGEKGSEAAVATAAAPTATIATGLAPTATALVTATATATAAKPIVGKPIAGKPTPGQPTATTKPVVAPPPSVATIAKPTATTAPTSTLGAIDDRQ